ncbi:hypothetical protein GS682_04955 [Nostoc sp. B(2019)]|nr:hypothetical protein [Nostoc sp. B(2019)]
MSAFNPNQRQLTPAEWQAIASNSIEDNSCQYLIIGGIVLGFFAASATGFPPTGLLVAAWGFYSAWNKTKQANRSEVAINNYGCVAHVLEGDNFRDFRRQVGDAEILRQIEWATERGYKLSNDALDYWETQSASQKLEEIVTPMQLSTANANKETHQMYSYALIPDKQTNFVDFRREVLDLAKSLAEDLKNTLIIGVPGVGKDFFVSNALEWVRKLHPNCTIFFIDPKNDPKETGYFQGRVDQLFRLNICEATPAEVYGWVQRCLETYDKFDAGTGLKLLIFNEIAATNKTLSNVKGALNWLTSKMVGYSSSGDSRGIKIWGMSQNAHNSGIGFDGGSKSIFIPIVIVSESQISASEQVLRAQIIPNDKRLKSDEIKALCQKSPVKRAIFHGGLNEWFPMPQMTNYSGYDRDNRTFLNAPKNQAQILISKLEATDKTSLDSFILEDLGITGEKKERMRQGILEAIAGLNRNDLLQKFAS